MYAKKVKNEKINFFTTKVQLVQAREQLKVNCYP